MIETNQYTEEEYFQTIFMKLLMIGCDEAACEGNAHRIMDCWTFNGVLDTDGLDTIIEGWG